MARALVRRAVGATRACGAVPIGAGSPSGRARRRSWHRRRRDRGAHIEDCRAGSRAPCAPEAGAGRRSAAARGPARTRRTDLARGKLARSRALVRERRYDPAALPTGMPRRLLLAAFSAAAIAILIAAPAAFADAFTPESGGSPNADDIDTLYKLTLYIGIVIFLLVEGTLIWSLVKYRAKRGGVADQIRGNTPLEIGWTVGRRVDPRGPHRGDLPLPRRHREPARLRPERPAARPRLSSRRSTSRIRPRTAARSCAST